MKKSIFTTVLAAHLFFFGPAPALAKDHALSVPPGGVVHVVVSGEDASDVASLYGVSERQLTDLNSNSDWQAGTPIIVPRPDHPWPTHTVRPGETLWRISKAYGVSLEELRQANSLSDNQLFTGRVLSVPRAKKPTWNPPDPVPTLPIVTVDASTGQKVEELASVEPQLSPPTPSPQLQGSWIEVRLPDNRRAWARVDTLVVGSWQPQSPQRVLEVARDFVGVPYRYGGVDPNGWDCSGFVQEVYRLGGHQVPRMADAQYEACEKIKSEEMMPGDLVFFNTDGSGVSHVGIYTGDGRFLHASSSRGVVEDSLKEGYFSARLVGAGRIPDWQRQAVGAADLSESTK